MHPQILKDATGEMSTLRNELDSLGGTARPEKDEHSHHHQNHDHHSESDSSAAGFDKHAGHHTPDFKKDSGLHWYFLFRCPALSHNDSAVARFYDCFSGG